ncbi:L,D-transpeptidase family protein [Ovoidimarina sediminis]|uniref:L,D-transpeptidase family protein n=1 Tax=Ovoidimarina sediminis TaxID=3079856 RepID=UPI002911B1C7|nr:L,D-transpeptidase family protein [Rhodophyticola sp. MJ-SS7]MDU8944526.1 L,D-transpeptidase family protein [Rhodophyticola sp. MJ-SS7]
MRPFIVAAALAAAVVLSGCSSKFRTYDGPEVTRIMVFKEARKMYLLHGDTALRSYEFELGFEPVGHKAVEGDGRTPEGEYIIDRRNPESRFHLSIGISYPNARDVEVARALGMSPGGDIFIHGTPKPFSGRGDDWTWGCIAVTNDEIEEIYAMVKDGTPISIYP